jgi:hypothetical protein
MTQTSPIYHSDVIVTADNYQLGQAIKLYHRQTGIDPAQKFFPHYLMVANLTIGDDFYVPTHYITAHNNHAGMHILSLTLADIKKEQFTNLPRFIAGGQASEEDLPQPPNERPEPQTKELETAPLPPNW